MKKYLLIFPILLLIGCQSRDIKWTKVTKMKNGDVVTEDFRDNTTGAVNWSEGAGKNMPFSHLTFSGVSAGK